MNHSNFHFTNAILCVVGIIMVLGVPAIPFWLAWVCVGLGVYSVLKGVELYRLEK